MARAAAQAEPDSEGHPAVTVTVMVTVTGGELPSVRVAGRRVTIGSGLQVQVQVVDIPVS
jgi:hypothetical protein